MSENGEIYTAGKNFTLPPAVMALKNSTSARNWQKLFVGPKNARTITKVFVHCKRHKRSWKTLQTLKQHENRENTLKSHDWKTMKTLKTWKNFEKPWEITWKKRKRTLKYHENHESPWKPKKRLLKTINTMKTPWTRSSSLFSWSASSAPIQEQLWPTEVLTEVNSTGAFACIQFYFDWWRVGELSCDRCSAARNCAVL